MSKLLNKYNLITLALLISASVFSQQIKDEFYLSSSLGASKFMYNLNTGSGNFEAGGALGMGYKRFFNENIGLSIGLEGAYYNGSFKSPGITYKENVYDHLFKDVDYTGVMSAFREKHTTYNINFPILLHLQTSGKHKLYTAFGAKVSLPVALYSQQDPVEDVRATGYAPLYNTHLDNIRIMGYGAFNKPNKVSRQAQHIGVKTKVAAILSAEAGMKWNIYPRTYLYTAAFVDYGLTSLTYVPDSEKYRDFLPHSGMSALDNDNVNSPIIINSILNSRYDYDHRDKGMNFIKDDVFRPFIVGLKFTIAIGPVLKQEPLTNVVYVVPEIAKQVIEEPIAVIEKPIVTAEPVVEPIVAYKPIIDVTDNHLLNLIEIEKAKNPNTDIALVIDNYVINKSNLIKYWTDIVDNLIVPLRDKGDYYFVLEGHTCDLGTYSVNDRLSLQRANVVRNYMISKGFDPGKIAIVGKGEHYPVVPNTSLKNRLTNRRVVFFISNM